MVMIIHCGGIVVMDGGGLFTVTSRHIYFKPSFYKDLKEIVNSIIRVPLSHIYCC